MLAEDAAVYKLVGPVLIRQDQYEAKANVQKRLDFIASEIASLESQLKTIDEKRLRKQQQARTCHAIVLFVLRSDLRHAMLQVMKIQQEHQRLQAPAS